jgi:cellobiose phosphorylase
VPPEWDGFSIEYRHRGTPYVITVEKQLPGAMIQLNIDGQVQPPGRNVVDLLTDQATHTVHVAWLAASETGGVAVSQGA